MRFIIIVRGNKETEKGSEPDPSLIAAMADYHEQLARAGVLLDESAIQPTSKGLRVKYAGGKRTWVDGPFAESREVIAGYTVIQVRTREEAIEWARRFPAPHGEANEGEIEIRQLFDPI